MNLILFNPDELRAESLGCYGHPLAPTPHIDRFAAEGVRFDQCHVQHPVCTPSRCSFMTGWYPHVRGHRTLWNPLRADEPNLLRGLRDAGYEVVWGGKNDTLSPEAFASSVDDFRVGDRSSLPKAGSSGRNPFRSGDPRDASFLYEATARRMEDLNDYRTVDGAIEYLRAGPKRPFAMWLSLAYPHPPYHAPAPWHDLIDPEALPPLRGADLLNKPDFHAHIRRSRRLDEVDPACLRKINAVYLGMIGLVDALFGRLLATVDEAGLADDTVIVFFSDHGDWAGDYGLVEKWPSALDDTMTRVPFIVRLPGGRGGHVVRELVELLDLPATLLGLAGTKPAYPQFGRDLGPQLRGAAGDPERCAFAEGGYDPHEPLSFEGRLDSDPIFKDPTNIYYAKGKLQQDHPLSVCRATMVRSATHKLIHRRLGVSELYDLRSDPRELVNRHGDPAWSEVQARLERRLLDWLQQTSDVTPTDRLPRGFPERPSA